MGFYSRHIFPRLLDWSLGNEEVKHQRAQALAAARGRVLEIGFGTGLNLPHYPDAVTTLVTVEPERMLEKRVAKRIAEARFPVEQFHLDASGRLPFEANGFDTVVTTFALCTILRVSAALAEMRRALKPTGIYIFLEHGRSDDPRVARWQDRFNPIQNVVACGCNINRPIDRIIKDAGFEPTELHRYLMPGVPQMFGEMYRGTARKL
ncbi:MAG TPA: class I SAM-dependent methyltransferase [Blastocatellia bacterium]|nr:class I SAM-dependent methyltransferase [Blastocatellia bacterium]